MGLTDNLCVRCIISALRWVPVLFIFAILCWAYYAYVIQLCLQTAYYITERVLYLLGFHFLLSMFLWSYYVTIFYPVGRPPKSFYLGASERSNLVNLSDDYYCRELLDQFAREQQISVENRNFDGSLRYCYKCACIKPDRSHHCSVCGHCVLKFDHHCPWVNTCVNFKNYKFFMLFMFYGFSLCLWILFTDLQYFIAFWKSSLELSLGFGRFHILFLFFVSGMFSVSLACLLAYHVYLTARNRSTIETFRPPIFVYGVDRNAYNLGFRRNFEQIFGKRVLCWFLPIFTTAGDGVQYPMRPGVGQQPPSSEYAFFRIGDGVKFDREGFCSERRRLLLIDSDDSDSESLANIV